MINDLVSIIMTCYNSEQFVAQSINSVLAQSYPFWELIIVNNCSTDSSKDIVTKYQQQDQRIKLITLTENFGLQNARNVAIQAATGPYISFLDDDDLWLAEKLTTQLEFMKQHNLCFTYSSYQLTNENNAYLGNFIPKLSISYNDILKTNYVGCLTAIYDARMFGKIYFQDTRIDDYLIWLHILKKTSIAYGIKTSLAIYRIKTISYSSNKLKAAASQWYVYRKIEKLSLLKSCYYFLCYGFYGILKYKLKRWITT